MFHSLSRFHGDYRTADFLELQEEDGAANHADDHSDGHTKFFRPRSIGFIGV